MRSKNDGDERKARACDDAHTDQVVVTHELQVIGDVRVVRLEHAV
jgi:hypothetical protein